jgi:hypothetical protein
MKSVNFPLTLGFGRFLPIPTGYNAYSVRHRLQHHIYKAELWLATIILHPLLIHHLILHNFTM